MFNISREFGLINPMLSENLYNFYHVRQKEEATKHAHQPHWSLGKCALMVQKIN